MQKITKEEKQLLSIQFWNEEHNLVLSFVFESESLESFFAEIRDFFDLEYCGDYKNVVYFEALDIRHSVPVSYFRDFYWNVTSVENRNLEVEKKWDEKE